MGFEIGELVWAKMKGFPPWPARVIKPTAAAKAPKNKKVNTFVLFFGTKDCAWIADENIVPHTENAFDTLTKKKSKAYQQAVDELLNYQGAKEARKRASPKVKDKVKNVNTVESGKKKNKIPSPVPIPKKRERKVLTPKAIKRVPKKKHVEGNADSSLKSSKLYIPDWPVDSGHSEKYQSCEDISSSSDSSERNVSSINELGLLDVVDLDKDSVSECYKKFGFLGLNDLGRAVLAKFIECGMDVMLWHEEIQQFTEFATKNKAKVADSPAQLIVECDITFCCYETDSDAFRNIIFGEKGILEGFEEAEKLKQKYKGYVLLNRIDYETSKEINEAITIKNGYYLEAPVLGTSEGVADHDLLILASGNRKLFTSCEKCFGAISNKILFVSCDIGFSSKMSVLINAVSGSLFAALNETLVLAERLSVYKDDFCQVLTKMLQGDTIGQKLEKMSKHNYEAVTPLKHIQKDMNLALNLSNAVSQSMPISSTANELFKYARLMKYSDSDVSAIYKVVKSC